MPGNWPVRFGAGRRVKGPCSHGTSLAAYAIVLPIPTKSLLPLRRREETVGEEQEPPRMYAGEVSGVSSVRRCSDPNRRSRMARACW